MKYGCVHCSREGKNIESAYGTHHRGAPAWVFVKAKTPPQISCREPSPASPSHALNPFLLHVPSPFFPLIFPSHSFLCSLVRPLASPLLPFPFLLPSLLPYPTTSFHSSQPPSSLPAPPLTFLLFPRSLLPPFAYPNFSIRPTFFHYSILRTTPSPSIRSILPSPSPHPISPLFPLTSLFPFPPPHPTIPFPCSFCPFPSLFHSSLPTPSPHFS